MRRAAGCTIHALTNGLLAVFRIAAAFVALFLTVTQVYATPFTVTVPGTALTIPSTYPQAGGVVIVLIGLNDNVYYQFSNPSTMYQGYNNSGTGPVAWQGNPLQIAPVTTISCGIQSCTNYFGGGIKSIAVRFSASDGDTKAADFDVNKITLGLNGTQIGNFSNILTQTTNVPGTTVTGSSNGFGNNTFDTGWFTSTDPTLLANILSTGTLKSTLTDATPNDNYWDFRVGSDAAAGTPPIVAPGATIKKTASTSTFAAVGDIVNYNYVLTNIGSVWINPLTVIDNKIPSITCGAPSPAPVLLPAAAGQVDPGSVVNCTAAYTITQADLDAGKVTNIATVSGTPQYGALGPVDDTVTVTGPTRTPAIALTKAAGVTIVDSNGNGKVDAGDRITYALTVTNTGNVTLTAVAVSDPGSTIVGSPLASLAPGVANTTITASHILTQAEVDAGVFNNQASVTATPPAGVAGPVTDVSDPSSNAGNAVTSKTIPRVASIALVKTAGAITDTNGDGVQNAGDTLAYTFTITNTGTTTLSNISITDSNASMSGGPLATLAPGATNSATFTATHILTQGDVDAGQVDNSAVVNATPPAGMPGPTTDISGTTIGNDTPTPKTVTRTATLFLDKTSPTVNFNVAPATISYKFLLKNTGNVTLTNVQVSDVLPGVVLSGGPITLAPGATDSTTITGTYTVSQANLDAGGVTNTATASGKPPAGMAATMNSNSDSVTVPGIRNPAITVAKSTSAPINAIFVGQVITYNYLISNTGNTTALGPFTIADNVLTAPSPNCLAGNIAPGGTLACSGNYTVTVADVNFGTITNTASAKNATLTSPTVSLTVPAGAVPKLSVVKTPSPTTFTAVGQTIQYKYDVTNNGVTQFLNVVNITDNKIPGGAFTCFTPSGPNYFAAGTTQSCIKNYTVTQADVDAGFVTNQATASTAGPGGVQVTSVPVSATANAIQSPSLTVTKGVNPFTFSTAGTVLSYAITVKNTGNVTMSGVVLNDPMLPSMSCSRPMPAVLMPVNGATPGESITCTGSYTVTQSDIDRGTLPNTATATGNTPLGSTITASDTVNPVIPRTAAIALVKLPGSLVDSNGNGRPDVGEKLNFVFKVSNPGNVALTAVKVTDATALVTGGPLASLAPGVTDSTTFAASHTISQADINGGQYINSAFVTSTPPSGITGPITDISDESSPGSGAGLDDQTVTPLAKDTRLSNLKVLTAQSTTPIALGTVLDYSVVAKNIGNTTQNNVVVKDVNPVTTTSVTCVTLAPGASCGLTDSHTVTQADVDAGSFTNSGISNSNEVPTTPNSTVVSPIPQNSIVTLVKSMTSIADSNGNGKQDAGDTINYSLVVTNSGNTTLTNVVVTDPSATVVGSPIASLPPGAAGVVNLTASHVITQGDVDGGSVTNSAKVTANPPTGPPVQDISGTNSANNTATVTTLTPSPSILVTKAMTNNADNDGNLKVSLGDKLTYVVTVTNDGTTTQSNIKINDPLLGVAPATPQCVNLAPAATCVISGIYTVSQVDVDNGFVTNTASATSTAFPSATGNPKQNTSVTTPVPQTTAIDLAKSNSTASFATTGALSAPYKFSITNNGNTSQSGIVITDPLQPSYSCAVPTLAPASTYVGCPDLIYNALQPDLNAGQIVNTAVAKKGALVVATSNTITIPAVQNPSLSVLKEVQPGYTFTSVGEVITYKYTITNDGNVTMTANTVVVDNQVLPANMNCPAGLLAPAGTMICFGTHTVVLDDLKVGSLTNLAYAKSNLGAVVIKSPTTSVVLPPSSNPALSIVKIISAPSTPIFSAAGDMITYKFVVTNSGGATFTEPVTVIDDKIGTITCYNPLNASKPTFEPTETVTCTANYVTTQADVDAGFVTNQAYAQSFFGIGMIDITSPPQTATATATSAPAMTNLKTATMTTDVNGNGVKDVGDTLTYKIHLANTGNVTLSNITLNDPIVPSLTCPFTSLSTVASGATNPPNAMDCIGTYVITLANVNAGTITNNATAKAVTPKGASVGPVVGTAITNLAIASPAMTVVKTSNISSFLDGSQPIVYYFAVKNTGNVTLTNVVVTDPIDPAFTCTIPTLIPGQTDNSTCSLSYTVTQADIDAGGVTNTAAATATPARGTLSPVSSNTLVIAGPSRAPAMTVTKLTNSVPTKAGDTLNYTFHVNNTGNVTIQQVVINDPKCAAAPIFVSEDKLQNSTPLAPTPNFILDVLEIQTFTCVSNAITQAQVDAGTVDNTVTVTGVPNGGSFAGPTATTLKTPVVAAPSITLVKSTLASTLAAPNPTLASGLDATFTDAGDQLKYTFAITNTGNVTLSNVGVSDPKIATISCLAVTLAPNASTTCSGTYTLLQADLDAGSVTNQATGSGKPPSTVSNPTPSAVTDLSGTSPSNDTKTVSPIAQVAKWSVKKATATTPSKLGDVLAYTFDVKNEGSLTVTSLVVADAKCAAAPTLQSGDTIANGNLDVGETHRYVCNSIPVTQAEIDAGNVLNNVSVSGTSSLGAMTPATDSISTQVVPNATITLVKLAATPTTNLGLNTVLTDKDDTILYTFSIENTGNVSLSGISVSDPKIASVSCPATSLLPGGKMDCTATYTLIQADLDAGGVTNSATAKATAPSGTLDGVQDVSGTAANNNTSTVSPLPKTGAVALVKSGAAPGIANGLNPLVTDVTDTIAYTFTVTNIGNVTLSAIAVSDAKISGISCPATTLLPSTSINCTGTYTISQSDMDAGGVTNTATVKATSPGGVAGAVTDKSGTAANNDTDTYTAISAAPAITLVKALAASSPNPSIANGANAGVTDKLDVVNYLFTVHNTGNVTLNSVGVSDPKIASVVCLAATLAPNASTTCTGSYVIQQSDLDLGQVTNTATGSGTPPATASNPTPTAVTDSSGTAENNNTATVTAIPQVGALAVVKKVTSTLSVPPKAGDVVTYDITVHNTGNLTLKTVSVASDTLTDLATPTPNVIALTSGPTLVAASDVLGDNLLSVGETWTYQASHTLTQSDIDNGGISNTATVTALDPASKTVSDVSGASETDNLPTDTVIPPSKGMSLVKVAAAPTTANGLNTTLTDKDDTIAYTFTIENTGNVSISGISLTDPKIPNIICPSATLAPAATMDCAATYTLLQSDLDAGGVTNTATVKGTAPGGVVDAVVDVSGTAANNNTPTISPIAKVGAVTLVKSAGVPTIVNGTNPAVTDKDDILAYSFTVENTGNVTLSAISITDTKLNAISCPATSLLPATNMVCTANYTIQQADLDAGSVTNTAIVKATSPGGVAGAVTDQSGTAANNDSPTVTALAAAPALTVVKSLALSTPNPTVSKGVNSGITDVLDEMAYVFSVHNTGNVSLSSVGVSDPKISTVTCTATTLAPGAFTTCAGTYVIQQIDLDAGSVSNQATASGTQPATLANPNPTPTTATSGTAETNNNPTISTIPQVGAIGVVKKVTSTLSVPPKAGDVVTYDITIHNIGNMTLHSVSIASDSLTDFASPTPNNLTLTAAPSLVSSSDVGSDNLLSVGETWTYQASHQLSQSDIDNGGVSNTATGTALDPNGKTITDISGATEADDLPAQTIVPALPAMTLVKTADLGALKNPTMIGDKIKYTFDLVNTGNVTLNSIVVRDPKIATITCVLSSLAPGMATTCEGEYLIVQSDLDAGAATNQATLDAKTPKGVDVLQVVSGSAPGTTTATVSPLSVFPHMSATKTADLSALANPVQAGNVITYTITVLNDGNQTLSAVTLADSLLDGSGGAIALTTGPTLTSGDAGVSGKLDVGEAWVYTATYAIAQNDIDTGGISNSVTATAKNPQGLDQTAVSDDPSTAAPGDATATTIVPTPAIGLIKTIKAVNDDNGDGLVSAGDSVDYKFDVTNSGNVTLSNVHLEDYLIDDAGTVLSQPAVLGGPAKIAPRSAPYSTIFTVKYIITQDDVERGYVRNTATVTGTSPQGVDVSDISDPAVSTGSAPTRLKIVQVRAVSLTKTVKQNLDEDGNGFATLNDTLVYNITAKNTGNLILDPVTVEDLKLTPATSKTCSVVLPSKTCELEGTYQIKQSDVDARKITNDASAVAQGISAAIQRRLITPVYPPLTADQFTKTALKTDVKRGEKVPFMIKITGVPLNPMRVIDIMPPGFTFMPGSATANGVLIVPTININKLIFDGLTPDANGNVALKLYLVATGAAPDGTSTNHAELIYPGNGKVLLRAQADVRITPEHVFDCSEIIGKVFDDKNRDGYQNEGEPGLPGVRVATVKGLLVTTDKFGRFHVACADIPDKIIGSNFLMKLDTRTLPTGYRITTENPRDVRLTRGKITKLNFGAAITRVIKLDLNGKVFDEGSVELQEKWTDQLIKLIARMETEPSTLRMSYYMEGDEKSLAAHRLAAMQKRIEDLWSEKSDRYKIMIETRVVGVEEAPSK
jgi:uncharacterized repeat protein (TIGR01451 family)